MVHPEAVRRPGSPAGPCYRGVGELGRLTFATEVCDWRRFASVPNFKAFTGLVPSEYSSGGTQQRGQITHTGNTHLRTCPWDGAWAGP